MKNTASLREPTHESIAAQPIASATPFEVSIRRNQAGCSPRSAVAFAALDAVRSIVSWLNRSFRPAEHGHSGVCTSNRVNDCNGDVSPTTASASDEPQLLP
jgi:hypothetical protein